MAKNTDELTPMMRQFRTLKEKNPDAIMLFRCGDFYETYCEDAIVASKILGITLTHRNNKGANSATEMAGFPYHALDTYLPRLIRAGHRVAICDQLEDPKLAKKLVKRGITELVTPGVALNDNVLSVRENNFLAAVHMGNGLFGIALLDISTGEFLTAEGTAEYTDKLLGNFRPKELLYRRDCRNLIEQTFGTKYYTFPLDEWVFVEDVARKKLTAHFGVKNLKGFGVDHLHCGIVAAGAILEYLERTQHTHTSHIVTLRRIEEERYVRLDKFTVRNLELLEPMNDDGNSLLNVIDYTISPMGARLLRRWIVFPLRDIQAISRRQDGVEYFFRHPDFRQICSESLHSVGDLERLVSKVAVGRITPREMQQLRISLEALQPIKTACDNAEDESLRKIGARIELCKELLARLSRELAADPPLLVSKGGVIARGVNAELDELRDIAGGGRESLMKIQKTESEKTGIPSLKIGFNNVFGYYIEVRNTYKENVPQDWTRKQTLVNAERYITAELKEYEEKILGAEDKIQELEARLYAELVEAAGSYITSLQEDAGCLSQLDCLYSLAVAAEEHHYIRPLVDETTELEICEGRHPVIETQMPEGEEYIANDVRLDTHHQQIIIITGPNMAGKSALLRQTALITLLAQIGSFVPAAKAHIGMVDKIFTRVGASDNISVGESTFMVEMNEAANILNNMTSRSLVLFDELGRGTSTYDGISIAWAIVEYIHENSQSRPRTLFATHYHELNEMEKSFNRIKNYNVSVREIDGKVVFLRKLERGGSAHSFGIHVARLAGMPSEIVHRAEIILKELESNNSKESLSTAPSITTHSPKEGVQLSFFQLDDPVLSAVRDEIIHLDINNLTPIEALNKLNDIKRLVLGKDDQ